MKQYLEECPGACGKIARLIDSTLPESYPAISLATAISFFSTLKCGRIVSPEGIEPNIYTCIIAETGLGKGRAQAALRSIVKQCGLDIEIGEPASDSGLLKALNKKNRALLVWDELGYALEELAQTSIGCRATILKEMMKLFSTAGQKYIGREKATEDRQDIHAPYLNIFGASTPIRFYAALSNKFVHDGFLSRWLSFEQPFRADAKNQEHKDLCVPSALVTHIQQIDEWIPAQGDLGSVALIKKLTVSFEDKLTHQLNFFSFRDQTKSAKTSFERAFFSRAFELYVKLCLVMCDWDSVLGATSDFCLDLTKHLVQHQIRLCRENLKETDKREIKKIIRDSIDGEWLPQRDVTRKIQGLGVSRFERMQIIEDLVESGQWEKEFSNVNDSRKKTAIYRKV